MILLRIVMYLSQHEFSVSKNCLLNMLESFINETYRDADAILLLEGLKITSTSTRTYVSITIPMELYSGEDEFSWKMSDFHAYRLRNKMVGHRSTSAYFMALAASMRYKALGKGEGVKS